MHGKLKLGKLILFYDSNNISLDGDLSMSFIDDIQKRFESYGWQHLLVKDGNDLEEIAAAVEVAKAEKSKPTIIEVNQSLVLVLKNKELQQFMESLLELTV